MPRRILQIIATLDRAGAEKALVLLATNLPRDAFDVHVCALTRGGPYEAELRKHNIPVTVIGKRWKIDLCAFWRLRRLIAHLKPDLVQTWMFTANAYGRVAALSAGTKNLIASEQCADLWKRWYELEIDRRLAQRTARIVVNGQSVCDFYIAKGIPENKFVLISNGVGLHQPTRLSRSDLLRSLHLPEETRLIATVGRLWPQKRVDDAISAAQLLCAHDKDVHVLIIGDGPQRSALERIRDRAQLQDCVHFLGHRNDVDQMVEHFDVLWLASSYEGLPNVVMEAMSAAVPVVATDIPGNNDLVVPGKTGFLVPVGDYKSLARYTDKVLGDPELARQMGESGRKEMQESYSIDRLVNQHTELYHSVLNSPHRA